MNDGRGVRAGLSPTALGLARLPLGDELERPGIAAHVGIINRSDDAFAFPWEWGLGSKKLFKLGVDVKIEDGFVVDLHRSYDAETISAITSESDREML